MIDEQDSITVGKITVELLSGSYPYYTYQEHDSATELWCFSWATNPKTLEVCKIYDPEETLETASYVDSIELDPATAELDIPTVVRLARKWIEENAEEATND